MRITVTGASGFIGRRLIRQLDADNHELHILGRGLRTGFAPSIRFSNWDALAGTPPTASLDGADAVIHLAGEPVAQRWSLDVKRRIRDSRVDGTRRLVEALAHCSRRPAALVGASAVGLYGERGDETLTEDSAPGSGFLADVCREWENELDAARSLGMRVVKLRIGVVLGAEGGALARMLPPFRMGVGGRLGAGDQWMSWIHAEDLAALIRFAVAEGALSGAVNAVAPNPARNAEFTTALSRALRRPALLPVPLFAIRLLFGEMSEIVLASQKVLPRAAEAAGYRFRFPEVFPALKDLLG